MVYYMKGVGSLFFLLSACCCVHSPAAPFVFQICFCFLNYRNDQKFLDI